MVLALEQVYALSWRIKMGQLELGSGNSSLFSTHWRAVMRDRVSTTFRVRSPYRDVYSVLVYCEQVQDFTLSGRLGMVNPLGEHLSLQEAHMPDAIGALSVVFLTAAAVMAPPMVMIGVWLRRRLGSGMHHAIALAIFARGLTLFCWGCDCRRVSRAGASPLWSSLTWQLLDKGQHGVELLVFLLFSFGWKFYRSDLTWMEVRLLMYVAVATLHLGVMELICVAVVVRQEEYPLCPATLPVVSKQVAGVQLVRHVHDSLFHVVVILATSFHLQTIRAQLVIDSVSWELGTLYRKQLAYERFRWIFLGFLCAPLAENVVKVYFLPWDGEWLYIVLKEMRRLAIYMCMSAVLVKQDMPSWGALASIGAPANDGGPPARPRPAWQLELAALGSRARPE
ncbi:unnamed protein product [Prorocentrum cordatum]|uniref:Uncharacterized protein n=1 Tax=Prorocentrum cordatum TaxID=2364126 RepID=A0ABN9QDL6_9DINO|nr:unnamed protein product [Polarella glacialis]